MTKPSYGNVREVFDCTYPGALAENAAASAIIPITVGITGHKDLRAGDVPRIRSAVKVVLEGLHGKCPHTPIILLSPLAEGADLLVADVAAGLGTDLIAPLPLPVEEYIKDFSDAASREEFHRLLMYATQVFVIPAEATGSQPRDPRTAAYLRGGAFVVRHAHILLALWDGQPGVYEGGTADMVSLRLADGLDACRRKSPEHQHAQSGPVYHILTPRSTDPVARDQAEVGKLTLLFPRSWGLPEQARQTHENILRNIDDFNGDVLLRENELQEVITGNRSDLLNPEDVLASGPGMLATLRRYAATDFLARKYKMLRVRALLTMLSLIGSGFFFFQAYSELGWGLPALVAYLFFLSAGMGLYMLSARRRLEHKHEDYRALAEALRIQFFWDLGQFGKRASDYYLPKHRGELQWISYALNAWSLTSPGTDSRDARDRGARYEAIVQRWLLPQLEWFQKRGRQDHARLRWYERAGNGIFISGLVLAVVLLGRHFIPLLADALDQHVLTLCAATALAASGLLHGYAEKLVLAEQSKQYQRMANLFNHAQRELEHVGGAAGDIQLSGDILLELGKESLLESGDWLLLHRARPMEVPRA